MRASWAPLASTPPLQRFPFHYFGRDTGVSGAGGGISVPRSVQMRVLCLFQASSPACTELEMSVMDWLANMLGLPEHFLHHHPGSQGGGVLQVPMMTTFSLTQRAKATPSPPFSRSPWSVLYLTPSPLSPPSHPVPSL